MITSTIETRDRDNTVTDLPVLVDAVPKEQAHGRVTVPGDYDIVVRVLPLDAPEMLASEAGIHQLKERFNVVTKTKRDRTQLLALLKLVQALQKRSLERLAAYEEIESEVETHEWLAKQKEFQNAFGRTQWRMPTKAQIKAERARTVANVRRRTRFPISEVSRRLNELLRNARFVIWWSERERQLRPGLYCEEMSTAIAALIFSRIASTKGRAVCAHCGREFVRGKRTQTFCTLRCGNAARKARQRVREKGE